MSKNATTSNYGAGGAALRKAFGPDIEIVDATSPLRVQPNQEDIRSAIAGDPMNCVLSRACQRSFGSKAVLFLGTVAYVDLLDEDGNRRLERFRIDGPGSRYIKAVDSFEPVSPRGFTLTPQPVSSQRKAMRRYHKKYKKAEAEAKARGVTLGDGTRRKRRPPTVARLATLYAIPQGGG